jgi:hypothetical protein
MGAELPNAATSREGRLFAGADFRARCGRSKVRLTAQSRIFTRRMSTATDTSGRLRNSSGISLPYPTLPYPTLPYPTLPYPTLPYPTLPYPTLPYPTLPYPTLPGTARHSRAT